MASGEIDEIVVTFVNIVSWGGKGGGGRRAPRLRCQRGGVEAGVSSGVKQE